MNTVNLSRRKFLKTAGLVGGGLVIGFTLPGCSPGKLPVKTIAGSFLPNAFVQITPDNLVRFYCPRAEMGQGVTTGLATLVAEELDVVPATLEIALAGAHKAYNNPDMGVQITGGSTSVHAHYLPLRQAGANTRSVIVDAAAKDLGISRDAITTEDAHIVAGGKRYPYGQFVATAATLKVPEKAPLKADADFKYIGKAFSRLDGVAKSTGTAVYAIDVDIPGMHYAVVRRSPVAGAKLASVDKTTASQMPGVTDVLEISSGVAVVAKKYWQARKAAAALEPRWETVPLSKVDASTVRTDYEKAMQTDKGVSSEDRGDVDAGFAAAKATVENTYWAPFLAHAPMEPMSAVLRLGKNDAELWAGTQGPGVAKGLVARFSGIDADNIQVHQTYLGGGFGRRATLTHIIEITEIAKASGKPIHLLWSREDDMRNGVYRPASLMKLKAGVNEGGEITAWQAKRVGGNITPETLKNMMPGLLPHAVGEGAIEFMVGLSNDLYKGWITDGSSIEGLAGDYDFPNRIVHHATVEHGVPLTFWRSVGNSFTAFAKESMIDELAEKAGQDPVEFRLKNLKNNPRLARVIATAGDVMKKMNPPAGHYLGFAAHSSFNTDVAEIAEVSIQDAQICVHKVTCVVDCGIAVNPDIVRAQLEGAVMFGLTAALYGKLELEDGAFKEGNFDTYPILRMDAAPDVDVVIVDSGTPPTGIGEPGLPPVAPAVANAVYAATGKRLRSLPLSLAS